MERDAGNLVERAASRPEFDRRMKIAYAKANAERPQSEKWIFEDNGRKVLRLISEDVDPVINHVRDARNFSSNGWTVNRTMRKIGSIPLIIIDQWMKEGFNLFRCKDPKEIRKRLNEYNKFRTTDRML